jgi:ferritin-like protein
MSSESYHEPFEALSLRARNMHRALTSLKEELEAVDWYLQRADVSDDEQLGAVLLHNRDEEIEHAAMVLEWLRRNDPVFDRHLRTYLFTEAPIETIERTKESVGDGTLSIGSLRK